MPKSIDKELYQTKKTTKDNQKKVLQNTKKQEKTPFAAQFRQVRTSLTKPLLSKYRKISHFFTNLDPQKQPQIDSNRLKTA